ncbi:hypothetical protein [Pantoea ananatis]|uniref:hypothetical protein n=1 Tax=Pantoea ananas TaxID=553 RepID=UPI0039B8CEFC
MEQKLYSPGGERGRGLTGFAQYMVSDHATAQITRWYAVGGVYQGIGRRSRRHQPPPRGARRCSMPACHRSAGLQRAADAVAQALDCSATRRCCGRWSMMSSHDFHARWRWRGCSGSRRWAPMKIARAIRRRAAPLPSDAASPRFSFAVPAGVTP